MQVGYSVDMENLIFNHLLNSSIQNQERSTRERWPQSSHHLWQGRDNQCNYSCKPQAYATLYKVSMFVYNSVNIDTFLQYQAQ